MTDDTTDSKLDVLAERVVQNAVGRAIDDDLTEKGDWSPWVMQHAYDTVDSLGNDDHVLADYAAIVDAFDGGEQAGADWKTLNFVWDHYSDDDGLADAIKGAAATAVGHTALDHLADLGLQG